MLLRVLRVNNRKWYGSDQIKNERRRDVILCDQLETRDFLRSLRVQVVCEKSDYDVYDEENVHRDIDTVHNWVFLIDERDAIGTISCRITNE
jgi:hypothetical protein